MILTTMGRAEGKELDFLLCIRIQCHDIKSICCKSEFSKIISSVSAAYYICRETLIPLGFFGFGFCFFLRREMQLFWLPRVSAAELILDGR